MNNVYKKDVSAYNEIDIYDILILYEVTNPALQHAIKKLLCTGKRGAKSYLQDLDEALFSINRAIEMQKGTTNE